MPLAECSNTIGVARTRTTAGLMVEKANPQYAVEHFTRELTCMPYVGRGDPAYEMPRTQNEPKGADALGTKIIQCAIDKRVRTVRQLCLSTSRTGRMTW